MIPHRGDFGVATPRAKLLGLTHQGPNLRNLNTISPLISLLSLSVVRE